MASNAFGTLMQQRNFNRKYFERHSSRKCMEGNIYKHYIWKIHESLRQGGFDEFYFDEAKVVFNKLTLNVSIKEHAQRRGNIGSARKFQGDIENDRRRSSRIIKN